MVTNANILVAATIYTLFCGTLFRLPIAGLSRLTDG